MRMLFFSLALIGCEFLAPQVFAQNAEDATPVETSAAFGDYLILYNAFPALTLPPAMTSSYGIERSNDNALINITILKKDIAQAARISGSYTDLINTRALAFREIREQNSISYIAQVKFHNREVLRFDVIVQPQLKPGETAPVGSPFNISFMRKFYID
jgi:hypothetical protein